EEPAGVDLRLSEAAAQERLPRGRGGRDDAERGVLDRLGGEAAALEVGARRGAAFAAEFAAGEREEALEQLRARITWAWMVERDGVDADALGDLAHHAGELGLLWD